jgi:hypothetical protein
MPENDEEMSEKRPSALKGTRVDPLMGSPVSVPPAKQARIDDVQAWVGNAGGKAGDGAVDGLAERVCPEVGAAGSVADEALFGESVGEASSRGLVSQILGAGSVPQVVPGQVPFFPGQGPPGFETGPYGPNWGKGGGHGFFHGYSQAPGSMPYPAVPGSPSISDLMAEVRAGN